jgi:hypothetical protein
VVYLATSKVIKKTTDIEQLSILFFALSLIVSTYAIIQVFGFDFKEWQGVLNMDGYVRPISLLGHPNFMAGYLAMTLPFAIWLYRKAWYWEVRAIYLLGICTSLVAIFYSQSRGMWISTIAGISIYYAITGVSKATVLRMAAIGLIVIATPLALSSKFRATVMDRVVHVINPGTARLEYPKAAFRIWKSYPWFGSGTDTFETAFQHERTPYYWEIERAGSPHRAHNDFMNTLATQGAIGAICALLLSLAVLSKVKKVISPQMAPAIAAIGVFYVEGISSFVVTSTGVMFVVCLALLRVERKCE